jgi:hypothetical protein
MPGTMLSCCPPTAYEIGAANKRSSSSRRLLFKNLIEVLPDALVPGLYKRVIIYI